MLPQEGPSGDTGCPASTLPSQFSADKAWTAKEMVCHHGGYVIQDGYIYGNHSHGWTCLDLKTGQKKWSATAVGKGSLCFADGMLHRFSEKEGQAGLATCCPEGLQLKGKVAFFSTKSGSGGHQLDSRPLRAGLGALSLDAERDGRAPTRREAFASPLPAVPLHHKTGGQAEAAVGRW